MGVTPEDIKYFNENKKSNELIKAIDNFTLRYGEVMLKKQAQNDALIMQIAENMTSSNVLNNNTPYSEDGSNRKALVDKIDMIFSDYSNKKLAPSIIDTYKARINDQFDQNIANDNMLTELNEVTMELGNLKDDFRSDDLDILYENAKNTLDQLSNKADAKLSENLRKSLLNIKELQNLSNDIYEFDQDPSTSEMDFGSGEEWVSLMSALDYLSMNDVKTAQKKFDKFKEAKFTPKDYDYSTVGMLFADKIDNVNNKIRVYDNTLAEDYSVIQIPSTKTGGWNFKVLKDVQSNLETETTKYLSDLSSSDPGIDSAMRNPGTYFASISKHAMKDGKFNRETLLEYIKDTHQKGLGIRARTSDTESRIFDIISSLAEAWYYLDSVETEIQMGNYSGGSNNNKLEVID